ASVAYDAQGGGSSSTRNGLPAGATCVATSTAVSVALSLVTSKGADPLSTNACPGPYVFVSQFSSWVVTWPDLTSTRMKPGWWCQPEKACGAKVSCWVTRSVGSLVWNLIRSSFRWMVSENVDRGARIVVLVPEPGLASAIATATVTEATTAIAI